MGYEAIIYSRYNFHAKCYSKFHVPVSYRVRLTYMICEIHDIIFTALLSQPIWGKSVVRMT